MLMSLWRSAVVFGFLLNAVLVAIVIRLVGDLVVTLGGFAVLIAYGGITVQILNGIDQARLEEERHDEIIIVLKEIAEK